MPLTFPLTSTGLEAYGTGITEELLQQSLLYRYRSVNVFVEQRFMCSVGGSTMEHAWLGSIYDQQVELLSSYF